ncbi:hypothetical protein [Streptomyces sp. bgisy126]
MSDYDDMNSDDLFSTDELREMGRDVEYRLDAQDEARWTAEEGTE